MKKLISMIFSVGATICVLVVCLFAWFSNNKYVGTTGVEGTTVGEHYEFKFYVYEDSNWLEIQDKISVGEINPGDIIYFRLDATKLSDEDYGFEARFNKIESKLRTESLIVVDNSIYLNTVLGNVWMWDLDEQNQVVVNNKVLYLYKNNQLTLEDYKIEDLIYMYSCDSDLNKIDRIEQIEHEMVNPGDSASVYFAIEYNEEASIVEGYDSNLYCYQTLILNYLVIDLVK